MRIADGAVAMSYNAMTSEGGAEIAVSCAAHPTEIIFSVHMRESVGKSFIFISPLPVFYIGLFIY